MAEKSETLVTKEERINEAKELFGRGSRNYCMKQFSDAADDLSSCCAIFSELHGSLSEECGLPYLLYAKSLIALGKDENNLIVPGEDEEEVDDDEEEGEDAGEDEGAEGDEKDQEQEDDKQEDDKQEEEEQEKCDGSKSDTKTSSKGEDKSPAVEKQNGEADKAEQEKAKKEETAEGSSAAAMDVQEDPQPGPSTSNGATKSREEQEDAAGNLQVAWEILELAVKIFEEQGEKAYENLSECYSELAGISLENSHFQEAINDYAKALEIYKKTNKSDLRMLAEVHYKVGLCHLMLNDFDSSIKSFHGAITELGKVIEEEKLKEQTEETKTIIEELEETKNEILEKVADVEEAKKTSIEEVKRELSKIIVSGAGESSNGVNNGAGPSSSSSAHGAANGSTSTTAAQPAATAAKPTTDISHLIKRKKPDSASTEVEGSPAKKTATETDNAATQNTTA